MGHIAHIRKQYTHDYIITMIKRRAKTIIQFLRIKWFFIRKKTLLFTKQNLVEIGPVVVEKIFYFVNVFLLFRNYLLFEKTGARHLNKREPTSPDDALC